MNKWIEFNNYINHILENNYSEKKLIQECNKLKNQLFNNNKFYPLHLGQFFKVLKTCNLDKDKNNILDHGCGGARSLLFLAFKGYKNLWGVDISFKNDFELEKINKLLNVSSGRKIDAAPRILQYDGSNLPFMKNYFNFIFSQQVIEHIPDKNYINYIKDEYRTLSENGIIYHQIPHRLIPFEAHTKSWFIHLFPKNVASKLYKIFAVDIKNTKKMLFLRWPNTIKQDFTMIFGSVNIITHNRLKNYVNSGEFSKTTGLIRKFISLIVKTPLLGPCIAKFFSPFVMIELVAKKKLKAKN